MKLGDWVIEWFFHCVILQKFGNLALQKTTLSILSLNFTKETTSVVLF